MRLAAVTERRRPWRICRRRRHSTRLDSTTSAAAAAVGGGRPRRAPPRQPGAHHLHTPIYSGHHCNFRHSRQLDAAAASVGRAVFQTPSLVLTAAMSYHGIGLRRCQGRLRSGAAELSRRGAPLAPAPPLLRSGSAARPDTAPPKVEERPSPRHQASCCRGAPLAPTPPLLRSGSATRTDTPILLPGSTALAQKLPLLLSGSAARPDTTPPTIGERRSSQH